MNKFSMTEFEKNLVELYNNAPLPFEAKRYVVLTFFRNVEESYQMALKKEEEKEEEVKQEGSE